jgi:hypothetical protein
VARILGRQVSPDAFELCYQVCQSVVVRAPALLIDGEALCLSGKLILRMVANGINAFRHVFELDPKQLS